MNSYFATFAHPGVSLQQPFDVSVVMPTILRAEIGDAMASVFAQDFPGRIQFLIGIDAHLGDLSIFDRACAARPANCVVQLLQPGYSTSVRHGGLCAARDGGVLRTVLSLMANSPLVAYLDDDNWWHPAHLRLLAEAIRGHDYAFAPRLFVHPRTRRIVALDEWESVGKGRGVYNQMYGGFIDPNCLMIDKLRCPDILPLWMVPQPDDEKAMSADRTVFIRLAADFDGVGTSDPTVYYRLDPRDAMHQERMRVMQALYDRAGG